MTMATNTDTGEKHPPLKKRKNRRGWNLPAGAPEKILKYNETGQPRPGKPRRNPHSEGNTRACRDELARKRMEPPTRRLTFWAQCRGSRRVYSKKDILELLGITPICPTIRSSGIGMADRCPREFLCRYRLGLRPRGYFPALTIGQIFHLIQAELFAGKSETEALSSPVGKQKAIEKELRSLAGPSGILPGGKTFDTVLRDFTKDYSYAKAMAIWAWRHDPLDFDRYEVLSVEELVEIKYKTIATPIRVRLDALLRERFSGHLYMVDHKTCSEGTAVRSLTLLFDIQPKLYRLATEAYLSGTPHAGKLRGCIHSLVNKYGIRQKKNQTWEAFLEELTERYETDAAAFTATPSDYPAGPPLLRSRLSFTEPVMTEALNLKLREASVMCRSRIDLARFERRASSCLRFRRLCPYHCLCSTGIGRWRQLISERFQVISRDDEDELGDIA